MANISKIKINGKVGYKNDAGDIIVEPVYDDGQSWSSHGYISVAQKRKYGVIDIDGNIVVPFEYSEAYHIFDDLFIVRKNLNYQDWVMGVIDSKGTIIIPLIYEYINHSNGFIACYKDAKLDYKCHEIESNGNVYKYTARTDSAVWYNRFGKIIYEGECTKCTNNYLIINKNKKLGVLDADGRQIVQCLYAEIHPSFEDCFIVRIDEDSSWEFGVIDNKENIIIDFNFEHIKDVHSSFYECYPRATYKGNEYKGWGTPKWFNRQGVLVYEGEGKALSSELIAVKSNDKWGVITNLNKKIVNYIYDNIDAIQDKIVVTKDNKIGVLDYDGSIIINPSYNRIDCAVIFDGITRYRLSLGYGRDLHGKYNDICIFDTNNLTSDICEVKISCATVVNNLNKSICYTNIFKRSKFDFNKLFILHGEDYCELFSVKDGIIANSRYDKILKLTEECFAVNKNNQWGVFRGDIANLIIPCEHDRLIYKGDAFVYLNKGDLWGVKTICPQNLGQSDVTTPEVNIPVSFKEIKLWANNVLFVAKRDRADSDETTVEEYTIIDTNGEIYDGMSFVSGVDIQYELFDSNLERILAHRNGKFGFISSKGYVTIPFQYDQIQKREDGYFDVKIGNAWGVIDISGKEVVNIKYSHRIPAKLKDAVVKNALTDKYGVLSEDGSEKIPSVYKSLEIKDGFILFKCEAIETIGNKYTGFGVMNQDGKELVPPCYMNHQIEEGHILSEKFRSWMTDCSNIYDLYTLSGELIFENICEFHYNADNNVYSFLFGSEGKWVERYDAWGEAMGENFVEGNGKWLFLDNNFKSIIRDSKGNQIRFNKGGKYSIAKVLDGKVTLDIDIPTEVMAKGFYSIQKGNVIITNNHDYDFCLKSAINIITGRQTPFYRTIEFVNESLFFFSEDKKIGLRDYDNIIFAAQYLFVTEPINGFYFAAKEIEKGYSCLELRSINDCDYILTAIEKVETPSLIYSIKTGGLKIEFREGENIDNLILPFHDIFDEAFIKCVSQNESKYYYREGNEIDYWIADDYRMGR